MNEIDRKLNDILGRSNVLVNEPMSKHTSLRIGGCADYFLLVDSVDKLKKLLEFLNEEKISITLIGNGTNLLVKDNGIRGAVIKLKLNDFKIKKNGNDILVTVEAGMPLGTLAGIATKEELTGIEFLAGIPGTIGGALRMNAGAYGKEMKDVVVKTRFMTMDGKIKTLNLKDHEFVYRNSIFSKLEGIIIDTTIKVSKGKKEEISAIISENMEKRRSTQPLEFPNAGSTFKRIDPYITAKLIDECGLKGYSVGDAEVSTKHAGFLINKGKANAEDFLKLVSVVKQKVKEKFDVDIELEIIVIGE